MIKLLFKTFVFVMMGIFVISGTHALIDMKSDWGRYSFQSMIPAGTTVTVNHPHSVEPAHVETQEPLHTGKRTLDVGTISTLTGFYVVAVLTGMGLRGRRKQFVNDCC
jgi:hypothetical protein